MKVTKKDISAIFGVSPGAIKQVGSKQLFLAYVYTDEVGYQKILISYRTIIGVYDEMWHITTKKYSRTTSYQITAFSRGKWGKVKRVDNDTLVSVLPASLQYYAK